MGFFYSTSIKLNKIDEFSIRLLKRVMNLNLAIQEKKRQVKFMLSLTGASSVGYITFKIISAENMSLSVSS